MERNLLHNEIVVLNGEMSGLAQNYASIGIYKQRFENIGERENFLNPVVEVPQNSPIYKDYYDPNKSGNLLYLTGTKEERKVKLSEKLTIGEFAIVPEHKTFFEGARVDEKLVDILQKLRDITGKKLAIIEGYIPPYYLKKLKRSEDDPSASGLSAKIKMERLKGVDIAKNILANVTDKVKISVGEKDIILTVKQPETSVISHVLGKAGEKLVHSVTSFKGTEPVNLGRANDAIDLFFEKFGHAFEEYFTKKELIKVAFKSRSSKPKMAISFLKIVGTLISFHPSGKAIGPVIKGAATIGEKLIEIFSNPPKLNVDRTDFATEEKDFKDFLSEKKREIKDEILSLSDLNLIAVKMQYDRFLTESYNGNGYWTLIEWAIYIYHRQTFEEVPTLKVTFDATTVGRDQDTVTNTEIQILPESPSENFQEYWINHINKFMQARNNILTGWYNLETDYLIKYYKFGPTNIDVTIKFSGNFPGGKVRVVNESIKLFQKIKDSSVTGNKDNFSFYFLALWNQDYGGRNEVVDSNRSRVFSQGGTYGETFTVVEFMAHSRESEIKFLISKNGVVSKRF